MRTCVRFHTCYVYEFFNGHVKTLIGIQSSYLTGHRLETTRQALHSRRQINE